MSVVFGMALIIAVLGVAAGSLALSLWALKESAAARFNSAALAHELELIRQKIWRDSDALK
jgi:hypothetical protein